MPGWEFFFLLGVCPVFGAGLKPLHGHVPEITKKLSPISRLAATNELHLAIGVPLRDPAGLDKFLADVYDPASPNYRHFLTPAEFTARFSATAADYAAVKNFALTNGFKISGEHGNRLLLDVTAKVPDVERAFHLKLNKFKHPTEAREFFAPDTEPTVDAAVAVLDVQGLSDYSRPHPRLHKMDTKVIVPKNGSAPDGSSYFGNDFRNAYALGTTLTGAGQQVGLLQFDGYYASDISAYAAAAGGGRTNIIIQTVLTDSYNGTPTTGANSGNGEVSLDIEMAMAMAPGLAKIVVFEASPTSGNANTIFAAMVTNTAIKQFSCSWGWSGGVNTTTENYFKQMATQGQSFFNASGDGDAFVNGSNNDVNSSSQSTYPSGSPNITQVGGTVMTMNGSGVSYVSETVWNDRTVNSNGGYWGSSGGISSNAIPVWQQGVSMVANGGSTTTRNIPDVAMTAKSCYVKYGNGTSGAFGGTSCAAPLWAGFMALVNQQAAANGNSSAGFINPAIYAIGKGSNSNYSYAACFHDTTTGDNYWPSSPTSFPAVYGYDLCTGWGTPNGQNLINALAGPVDILGITPVSGFTSVGLFGGPFTPSLQVFTLTNYGVASLNWSLINTSAWLTASASSGTLAAAGQATASVSLNSTANSLAVGSYAATVIFSNQTSGVQQIRQLTLQITDPLALLTTSGFTTYGAPGGPFNPGSQAIGFTNLSASPVAWSLINTSSWLSVSASSGSMAGNSSSSVMVSTNSATANLATGNFSATLVLSNQASHLTQSLVFTAAVGQNIVQNGGFETGDYSFWTLAHSGGPDLVDNGTKLTTVHTGTYAFAFGQTTLPATLSQTLSTVPGQTYLLSFWLSNPQSGSTETFQASWNGSTVYSINNPGVLGWTNQKFIVSATGTNTVLQFSVRNDPWYFGLDDVTVTPVSLPSIIQQPSSQTNLVGSSVTFITAVSGTPPLAYQWRTNGINLANSAVVSGATSNVLTLTGINTANAGNYTVVVTNAYGSITSSVANLTVVLPPSFTGNVTNRTLECGANTNNFSITTAGTPPLGIQWKLDGAPVIGATNANFGLTNLFSPSHTVTVIVTNLYASVSSNATLTVQDTRPPAISILGANPLTNELGSTFTDPGATASDTCAGSVSVSTNGLVNLNVVGTNILKYTATDGFTSVTNMRTVIVRDTTPPVISWSFTSLVLAAGTNTNVSMPNVTGTNFILATDLSGTVLITQSPTNNFLLPLGTNAVLLTVADPSGNTTYSTNRIIVAASTDSTPKISGPVVQAGGVTLHLAGGFGSTYVLESTANLLSGNWQPVTTNTLGIAGVWNFTDFGVTNIPTRFYRLKLVK